MLMILLPALLILSACQSEPAGVKEVAPEEEKLAEVDKASSSSQVKITVGENETAEDVTVDLGGLQVTGPVAGDSMLLQNANEPTALAGKKGVVIDANGMLPADLAATAGDTLMIYNSLDRQVDLYTTAGGAEVCPLLGATIEIPGGETVEFTLDQPAECQIINQLNTEQRVNLVVL